MHELSLATSAVELIEDQAKVHGFRRVHVVRVAVGALAYVEPDALRLAFAAASVGTCAQDARLELVPVPASGRCDGCGQGCEVTHDLALCPVCQGVLRVVDGTGVRVIDLDVE